MGKIETPAERVYHDLCHRVDMMIDKINDDIDFHALTCEGCAVCASDGEIFHKLLHKIGEDVHPTEQMHLLAILLLRSAKEQRTSTT